eukprot:gene9062-6360_t
MTLSLFGDPLPHEDDTAASLIRRTGYPPEGTYNQMPEAYACPCCINFDDENAKRPSVAEQEAAARKRKIRQLDIIEERAKAVPKQEDNKHRPFLDDDGLVDDEGNLPPPPPTTDALNDDLKKEWMNQNAGAKLIVTVHHGKNISAEVRDRLSVIVRCGAFEGQTARVPRGPATLNKWDELFEFPYPNSEEPLEILVIDHALKTEEKLLGGAVVPSEPLHDKERGEEEIVPVMMPEEMREAERGQEGPLGSIVVSWYVSEDGAGKDDRPAAETQSLEHPIACNFVAHHVFQYTDNGSTPYAGGVLCVLRDTDDHCSESVLYQPTDMNEPSLSPFYPRWGYHYLPENPSQIMQLNTERKLGHILVCVPNQESWNDKGKDKKGVSQDEEEELLVVGAVPLDFERLYHRGSAVLLIESKSKDDALWGEITIEWANKSLLDDREKEPRVISAKEALLVTVVRGLNLCHEDGTPIDLAAVEVNTQEMAGSTVYAPNVADGEDAYVVNWNQEVRFIGVKKREKEIEVKVFENGFPILIGKCVFNDEDEGVVIVPVFDFNNPEEHRGEIVLSYKRLHKSKNFHGRGRDGSGGLFGSDEGDEEEEEDEEAVTPPTKKRSAHHAHHREHHHRGKHHRDHDGSDEDGDESGSSDGSSSGSDGDNSEDDTDSGSDDRSVNDSDSGDDNDDDDDDSSDDESEDEDGNKKKHSKKTTKNTKKSSTKDGGDGKKKKKGNGSGDDDKKRKKKGDGSGDDDKKKKKGDDSGDDDKKKRDAKTGAGTDGTGDERRRGGKNDGNINGMGRDRGQSAGRGGRGAGRSGSRDPNSRGAGGAYRNRSDSRKPPVPTAADCPPRKNIWARKEIEGYRPPFFPAGTSQASNTHTNFENTVLATQQKKTIRNLEGRINKRNEDSVRRTSAQRARSQQRSRSIQYNKNNNKKNNKAKKKVVQRSRRCNTSGSKNRPERRKKISNETNKKESLNNKKKKRKSATINIVSCLLCYRNNLLSAAWKYSSYALSASSSAVLGLLFFFFSESNREVAISRRVRKSFRAYPGTKVSQMLLTIIAFLFCFRMKVGLWLYSAVDQLREESNGFEKVISTQIHEETTNQKTLPYATDHSLSGKYTKKNNFNEISSMTVLPLSLSCSKIRSKLKKINDRCGTAPPIG